jgi:uncharacterized membrane protein
VIFAAMLFVATTIAFTDPYTTSAERAAPVAGFVLELAAILAGFRLGSRKGWPLVALFGLGGIALFAFAFVRLAQVEEAGTWAWMLAPLILLPLVVTAFAWMAAPTREGRAVMDRIAGFQRYLSVTEENRLEVLHPPEKTPELFERFLPYAIALGVENRWAERFADVLARAAQTPGQNQGMAWYVGSQNAWTNPGRFASTVGAALATSVASAATAPGSSSGSGGGGFSGGGGGGGGGGGW